MSAAPEFINLPHRQRDPSPLVKKKADSRREAENRAEQTFWQWFAIGVLVFCWVAEATLCAERGF